MDFAEKVGMSLSVEDAITMPRKESSDVFANSPVVLEEFSNYPEDVSNLNRFASRV
jgi:hypothetical protein